MEDNIENEAKSRSRSNSARILVFEEPRAYLEQKQRCSVGPAQESVAVLMRNQPGNCGQIDHIATSNSKTF